MCDLAAWEKDKCRSNGGTRNWYVYNIADRDSYTLTAGVIDDITLASGTQAYQWTPDIESGSFTQTGTGNRENNTFFVAQSGMIMFKDKLQATNELMENVGRVSMLGVIVEDEMADGTFQARHYGLVNGLTVDTYEMTTGQLFEDMAGTTQNFIGKELMNAPLVDQAVIATILTPAP